MMQGAGKPAIILSAWKRETLLQVPDSWGRRGLRQKREDGPKLPADSAAIASIPDPGGQESTRGVMEARETRSYLRVSKSLRGNREPRGLDRVRRGRCGSGHADLIGTHRANKKEADSGRQCLR